MRASGYAYNCLSTAKQCRALFRVPSFQLSRNLRRLAIARLDINDRHGYPGFEDMVAPQGKVNGVKYEGSYELVATAIMRNRSPALKLAKSRHWPGLTMLEKFAREHCDISKPTEVIEAVWTTHQATAS